MGCRPYLMKKDVEQGAKDAVFYPALQLALRGFSPLAVTDCLNFGNPEKEKIMGQFVLSVESIAEACKSLDTPVISGNVSFYNESEGKNITPTPSIVMAGLKSQTIENPEAVFTKADEPVYLLYSHQFVFKEMKGYGALQNPLVKLFIDQMLELSQKNLFSTVSLVGKFGLAYHLARMVLAQGVGFSLCSSFPFSLFQERLYEVIVSVPKGREEEFKKESKNLSTAFMGNTKDIKGLNLNGCFINLQELNDSYNRDWSDLSL